MSNLSVSWMWRGACAAVLVVLVLLARSGTLFAQGPTGPFPAAGTQSVVIFADDFAGPCNLQKESSEKRTWGCENGEYTITNKLGKTYSGAWYPQEYEDAVIQVDARQVSGDSTVVEYGLDFRESSDGSISYEFNIDPVAGEYNVALYADDKFTDLIPYTPSSAINTGTAPNRLTVFTRGSAMAFFVNGQFVDVVTDDTGTSGGIGVHTYAQDPNVKVAFDNVFVWKATGTLTQPQVLPQPTVAKPAGTATVAKPTATVAKPTPTATPASTGSKYPLPAGKAGLLVISFVGKEINFTIAGKLNKIPPNGESFIVVDPGKYNISANVPGLGDLTRTLDLAADQVFQFSISAGG